MKYDRLYTLWQAVARLGSDAHPIIEIGSFRGGSAHFIAEALRWHGRSAAFYVCDTFQGHAIAEEGVDGSHRVGEQFVGTSFADVAAYLASFENIQVIAGDFRETSRRLEQVSGFAFAHIDVDVYAVTGHALEFVARHLVVGGSIVVDDYGFTTCPGAKKAVDEFAAAHPDFAVFHLLTGQALVVRTAGQLQAER
jgi:predicted O-methyltransferase YrrM